MAETQEIGCTCRCRIGLEVVQPESIGLQLEQFHIGFEDVPTLVISGGGTTAIEQFYLMPTACELQVIEHDDIIAMVDELWLDPTTTDHPAETIKVINVQKNGGIMEDFWSIPDQITIVAMSKTEITTMLDNLWTAIIGTSL